MENQRDYKTKFIEKTKVINLEHGRLPPQAIDVEEAILGSMMLDKNGLEDAMLILPTSDVFYKQSHVVIFEAIQSIYQRGEGIDLVTVSVELKRLGTLEVAGGDFYLIQLTQKVSSSAHIDYWCRIVLQYWMKRKIIMFSSQNIALAYDDTVDVFDLMSGWQKAFDSISDSVFTGRSTMSFPEALQDLKQQVELLTNNKSDVKLVGVDTGFRCLNKTTGGWRVQDLVIVAARPGMGKTSYVLKTCIENVKKNVAVGFISLEMSVQQLTARCVAIDTNFHLRQLLKNGFEKQEYFNTYSAHQNRMNNYPFYIDDSGRTDINDVCIKAKLWYRKFGIKLLVIDYIQLMTDRTVKGNRETEISSVSRRLKALAKELNIPVIALSQLSRAVETRGSSKRPLLSDLRESGAIEQDADVVQFLYRPGYYHIEMDESNYDDSLAPLIYAGADTEVIFAKYRAGSLGTELLKWVGDKTKFVDVTDTNDEVSYIDNNDLPKPSLDEAFGGDDNPF